jgi:hypothetical protein
LNSLITDVKTLPAGSFVFMAANAHFVAQKTLARFFGGGHQPKIIPIPR